MTLYSRFLACVFICLANTAYSAAPIQDLAVDFGTEKFLIPKIYLPSGGHFDKSKNYAALNIFVFLPDFRGGGSDIDALRQVGWHDQMTVLYEHGIQFRPAAEILKEDLETAHESQQDFHDLGQGCREYFGNFGPTRNLYACERKSEQLVFECNLPNEVPYPSCKVFINIDSRTSAIFTFSRKFKDQIWSIDGFVRSFLQSHRAS